MPMASLTALLDRAALSFGNAPFLCAGEDLLGFAAFAARVHRVAHGLRRLGVRTGDRVAVLLHRGLDEAVALLAAAVAGAIAVPLHGKLKDAQVRHVLDDCRPACVFVSELRRLALQRPGATLAGVRPVEVAALAGDGDDGGARPAAPADDGDAARPAVLLYTSGSTGQAKGVVQTHANLCAGAATVAGYLGLSAHDHVLALLPLGFDYGLNQLLSALRAGARATLADHLGAGELAALLRRHRPTGLAGVPSLWHEVAAGLAAGTLLAGDGASLRYVTNSGGTLRIADSARLRAAWPHVRVFAMYGLTEAFRSAFLPPDEFDAHPDSFGYAVPGVELLLVEPGTDRVLHGPATGELVHAGAFVAGGYWQRPADTAARFRPDPRGGGGTVVYSGDLVRRDVAGRHYFVARLDRLLKVHGHRVSPDEVAAAVVGMPGVGEVAVFGIDGGADGHRIVLWVAGDPDLPELPGAVLRRCRARLPSYMVPAIVRVAAQLPHNQNGKVDEAALRAALGADPAPGAPCTDAP